MIVRMDRRLSMASKTLWNIKLESLMKADMKSGRLYIDKHIYTRFGRTFKSMILTNFLT